MSKEQHFGFIKIEGERVILEDDGLRGFIEGLSFPQTVSKNVINATAKLFQDVTEQINEIFEEEVEELHESSEKLSERIDELIEELACQ